MNRAAGSPAAGSPAGADLLAATNKYERIFNSIKFESVLGGANMSIDLPKFKRGVTNAFKEESEWHKKLEKKYDDIVICQQLVLPVMWLNQHSKTVGHLMDLAQGAYKDKPFHKPTYAQWCMVVGSRFIYRGKVVVSGMTDENWAKFLHHSDPFRTTEQLPIVDFNNPTMMCSLLNGHPEITYVMFVYVASTYIFNPLIVVNAKDEKSIDGLLGILGKMLPWLASNDFGPPDATEAHKCLHLFRDNLLGIAYLVGDVPFSHGSNIDHVWSLEKEDTILSRACKCTESFLSKLLNGAWMLHSGEQTHWPDVEATCAKLEPSDPDTNKDAHYTRTHTHTHVTHTSAHTHCSHPRCPHSQT
jgi:hypothetical protein